MDQKWPQQYDDCLMNVLDKLTIPFDKLDRPSTFNFVLKYVTGIVAHRLERQIGINTVKKRLHSIKSEYEAFVGFTHLTGVKYNIHTNRVKVSRAYWDTVGKNQVRFQLTLY